MSSDAQLKDEIVEAFGESVRADTALMDECEYRGTIPHGSILICVYRHLHFPYIRPPTYRAKVQIRSVPPITSDNTPSASSICKHRRCLEEETRAGSRGVGRAEKDCRKGAAECGAEGWSCADDERKKRTFTWGIQWGYRWPVSCIVPVNQADTD